MELHKLDSNGIEYIYGVGPISDTNAQRYVNAITEGYKRWAGSYDIFGLPANVIVNVYPTYAEKKSDANVIVTVNSDFYSYVPTTILGSWNTRQDPMMYLNTGNRNMDSVSRLAQHEFGHVLGLFDAYANTPLTWKASSDKYENNDVMMSTSNPAVYSYNIAMMLYAFKNNKLQTYGNSTYGRTSEVYFRSESLKPLK